MAQRVGHPVYIVRARVCRRVGQIVVRQEAEQTLQLQKTLLFAGAFEMRDSARSGVDARSAEFFQSDLLARWAT
jgi:hypothetical protein